VREQINLIRFFSSSSFQAGLATAFSSAQLSLDPERCERKKEGVPSIALLFEAYARHVEDMPSL
jgi:hypothetical protein